MGLKQPSDDGQLGQRKKSRLSFCEPRINEKILCQNLLDTIKFVLRRNCMAPNTYIKA